MKVCVHVYTRRLQLLGVFCMLYHLARFDTPALPKMRLIVTKQNRLQGFCLSVCVCVCVAQYPAPSRSAPVILTRTCVFCAAGPACCARSECEQLRSLLSRDRLYALHDSEIKEGSKFGPEPESVCVCLCVCVCAYVYVYGG